MSVLLFLKKLYNLAADNKRRAIPLLCCSAVVCRYIFAKIYRYSYSYPPGADGIPYFGLFWHKILLNIFGLKSFAHPYSNRAMARIYGPIFCHWIFSKQITVISSTSVIKPLLLLRPKNTSMEDDQKSTSAHMLNRGNMKHYFDVLSNDDNTYSFGSEDYDSWKGRRKLAQQALLSMCTSHYVNKIVGDIMTDTILPMIDEIIEKQKMNIDGNLFYPRKLMTYAALNTIFYASFGRNLSITDEDGIQLGELIRKSFKEMGSQMYWNEFLFLRKFGSLFEPKKAIQIRHERCEFIRRLINEREMEFKEQSLMDNPQSFIDHMLVAEAENKISRSELEADVGILFSAGTDTTSSTLEHAIIYAAKYKDVQIRVREELFKVHECLQRNENFGNGRNEFNIKLLSKMPIFRAFIKEVFRCSSVAAGGVRHCVSDDIWITCNSKRYCIPKNSRVVYMVQYMDIFSSGERWKSGCGDDITLENWLETGVDENSLVFKHNRSEIWFGYGHRDCVGKQLATKELHIVMGYLLLNYEFGFKDDIIPDIEESYYGVLVLKPELGVTVKAL